MDQHRALHRGFGDPCIVKKNLCRTFHFQLLFFKDFLSNSESYNWKYTRSGN